MSASFIVAALVLLIIVLIVLLWPLLRPRRADRTTRQAMNAAIYREQLRELETDLKEGSLAQPAFDEAQRELQRRLLVEADEGEAVPARSGTPRATRTALALAILVPLTSAALYAWLGTPDALKPGLDHKVTAGEMDKMVEALAARLEKNPDDLRGWAMLARSYKAMRRFDDAEKAFAKLGDAINEDAGLLATYADLLAVRANGNLEGKPLQLIEKALELEPDHSMALSLAGTAAYERKDFATAVKYWERLLKTLPPESDDAKGVAEAIAKLRQEHNLGQATGKGSVAEKADNDAKLTKNDKSVTPAPLKGRVELAKAAQGKVSATDVVFIFARPAEGGRMPLAAKRVTVADLPYDFVLDDSLAMMSGQKLSEARQVVVEARVSKSGDVKPAPGDWVGQIGPIKPDAIGVKLSIDKQVP